MTMTPAQMEAEILKLRRDVGSFETKIDLAVKPTELPNGEYPVSYRQRQLGVGIDSLTDTVAAGGGGGASSSAPPIDAQTIAQLLAGAFDVHFAMDTSQTPPRGYLSIGMSPDFDSQAPLQLGGRVAAEIGGYSNTNKTDGQNANEPHSNTMVIADNDGGMRWRQYLKYGKKGKVRNTLNRNAMITAVDSVGELCQSVEEVGQTSDGGQMWYVKYDWANKVIRWLAMKPLWTVTLARSQAKYGANDVDVITERQT